MNFQIQGLHHVTVIASNAQRNLTFYRDILGLRLIKKTVNFDDPSTYHFYYGNEKAEPGSVLTFFPWANISPGRRGVGQATEVALSVPEDSFNFWIERLKSLNVIYNNPSYKFDQEYLTLLDPDGLKLELVKSSDDIRIPSSNSPIPIDYGVRGFHSVTITLSEVQPTAKLLTEIFGYKLVKQEVNRYRFSVDTVPSAKFIDLVHAPGEQSGVVAGGSVHHIAFRVTNEESHLHFREKIKEAGFNVTEQIDRQYFKAIYFREPGGVLFEVSTDIPGFYIDEDNETLGKNLKLPLQYENRRAQIEKSLPVVI